MNKSKKNNSIHFFTYLVLLLSCSQNKRVDSNLAADSSMSFPKDTNIINNKIGHQYLGNKTKGINDSNLIERNHSITAIENSDAQNYTKMRADSFIQTILGSNKLEWQFNPADRDIPTYIQVFMQAGIKKIYAYSNKNYPRREKPSAYSHFVLFLLEYKNKELAKESFDRFISDTEKSEINKEDIGKKEYDRIKGIYVISKYGGLVGIRNNFIISLVETCPGPTKFKNWTEYENYFIKTIFDKSDIGSTILNANCGGMKYQKQKIEFD